MKTAQTISLLTWSAVVMVGVSSAGCGSADTAAPTDGPNFGSTIMIDTPTMLDAAAPPCTEPHTVCVTVRMPDSIPGPPTHLAIGYFKAVPVKTLADARGVVTSPPLVAGQQFRLMAKDGNLSGALYPVVLVYEPGGGDVIAVDNLDYTAEATRSYDFGGAAINVTEVMQLIYGI